MKRTAAVGCHLTQFSFTAGIGYIYPCSSFT